MMAKKREAIHAVVRKNHNTQSTLSKITACANMINFDEWQHFQE